MVRISSEFSSGALFIWTSTVKRVPRTNVFLPKSLPDKCFIHHIDADGTTRSALIVDLGRLSKDLRVVYSIASFLSALVTVLRFIKGTFPTNYIPTIEDTYRQVGGRF